MSVLTGGIFSNPSGKTGGVVFGAARTRTGKKVTSRLLVPPSNPNTAAQQIQRGKFSQSLAIVRLIGSAIYQGDWNRSIGQLPGFQSMMNIFLNSLNSIYTLTTIPTINLGSLHYPLTWTEDFVQALNNWKTTWSTELGVNGTTADVAVLIVIGSDVAASPLERFVIVDETVTRVAGTKDIVVGFAGLDVTGLLYFRGAGTADGLLSGTSFLQGTTGT